MRQNLGEKGSGQSLYPIQLSSKLKSPLNSMPIMVFGHFFLGVEREVGF